MEVPEGARSTAQCWLLTLMKSEAGAENTVGCEMADVKSRSCNHDIFRFQVIGIRLGLDATATTLTLGVNSTWLCDAWNLNCVSDGDDIRISSKRERRGTGFVASHMS